MFKNNHYNFFIDFVSDIVIKPVGVKRKRIETPFADTSDEDLNPFFTQQDAKEEEEQEEDFFQKEENGDETAKIIGEKTGKKTAGQSGNVHYKEVKPAAPSARILTSTPVNAASNPPSAAKNKIVAKRIQAAKMSDKSYQAPGKGMAPRNFGNILNEVEGSKMGSSSSKNGNGKNSENIEQERKNLTKKIDELKCNFDFSKKPSQAQEIPDFKCKLGNSQVLLIEQKKIKGTNSREPVEFWAITCARRLPNNSFYSFSFNISMLDTYISAMKAAKDHLDRYLHSPRTWTSCAEEAAARGFSQGSKRNNDDDDHERFGDLSGSSFQ